MNLFDSTFLILCTPIVFALINHKIIRIQPTIAILIGGLCSALLLHFMQRHAPIIAPKIMHAILKLNFSDILLKGFLHFLLFAGAMQINLTEIKKQLIPISTLAIISTLTSTILIGICTHPFMIWINLPLPWHYCFLFGALISPTDPIAVIANMMALKAPKKITTLIAGEALFNDGVAIVIYMTLYHITFTSHTPSTLETITFFFHQSILGSIFGIILGYVGNRLLQTLNDDNLQVMTSILLVIIGYYIANAMQLSGPLAMVFTGLIMGHHIKKQSFLHTFWLLIDELLNLILFMLVGLEIIHIPLFTISAINISLIFIMIICIRYSSIILANGILFPLKKMLSFKQVWLLTWGGLRGALALGLALSLPHSHYSLIISQMTIMIVIASLIIQGLTVHYFIKRL
jgi:monovalent cation:H+ antiporter, CPA1 family